MVTGKSITATDKVFTGGNVYFKFVGGRRSGDKVPVTRDTFFIGRSQNNNLVLDDRSVSRKHAVLNFIDGQFNLSDLNSFKGTVVNGEKIKEAVIKNGDKIRIGEIQLEFLEGEVSTTAPVKHGRRIYWVIAAAIAVFVIVAGVLMLGKKGGQMPKDLIGEIEYNYSQGVRAYNIDRDTSEASLYWQKVLELDPERASIQARNAWILLNKIPSNSGSNDSR